MVIESFPKEGSKSAASKSIYVVNIEWKKEVVFGRGQEADIKINDISVSRTHGIIQLLENTSLLLLDNSSKFGTLVLCWTPVLLSAVTSDIHGY